MSTRQRTIDRQLQQHRDRERHILKKQRSRHVAEVNAANSGCLMTITATVSATLVVLAALIALTRKVAPR